MEVILQLSQEEIKPVRKLTPEIPRDLETIVMKCLERNPDRRYDSAKAVAEDLERYLNGDSIQARPTTWKYKLQKTIRKNKKVAAILAISSLVAILLGGIGLFSWWRSGQRIKVAQEFAQTVENMESRIRIARMAPLHNLNEDKKLVNEKISAIKQRIQEAGSITEAPGYYAIGRGYIELSNFAQAKDSLQKAWNLGYRTPQNAYALGLTFGQLYQQKLEAAQRIENRAQKETTLKEIKTNYRQPALDYLRKSGGLEPGLEDYVAGLIALYEEKYTEALQKAKSAQQKSWWLFEAGKLEADVRMALGLKDFDSGSYETAAKYYEQAGKAYESASRIARSEPSLYEGNCWRWLQMMILETTRGGSPKEPMNQGLLACDDALKVNPQSSIAYSRKAQMWWRWGDEQFYRGEDSQEAVDNSIRFATAALQRDPKDYYTYSELGNAYELRGEIENTNGKDPTNSHYKAIEYLKTAAKIRPEYYSPYNNIAVVYMALARYDMDHHLEARKKLEQAIVYSKKAIELAPNWVGAHNSLGNSYILLAEYERKKGLNYEDSLKEAIASLNKAHEASPNHPAPFLNLATAYADYAKYQLNHGSNPEDSAKNAIENAEKCLALGGESYAICSNIIGLAFVNKAKFKILQGGSPEDLLQNAIQHSSKTLESGSNDDQQAYDNLLDAQQTYAEYKINKKMDPTALLTSARKLQQSGAAKFPKSSFHLWESEIEILSARWQLQTGQSPVNSLVKAETYANLFLKQNPDEADAYAALAEIAEIKAEWLEQQNKPFGNIANDGISTARKALQLNPSLAEVHAIAGKLHWLNSKNDEAIDSFQKAIAMNKNLESKYQPLINKIQNQQ